MRLLFEGKVPDGDGPAARKDFYIYAWIHDGSYLESFQAVLAEAVTLIYRAPRYVTVGRIGHIPMTRAIRASEEPEDEELIRGVMHDLRNEHFPHMLSAVELLAKGETLPVVFLTEEEAAYLSEIVQKAGV